MKFNPREPKTKANEPCPTAALSSQDGSISDCVTPLFKQLSGELPSIHSYTHAVSSAIHTVRKISVHLPNRVWGDRGQEYQLRAFVEIQEKNNEKRLAGRFG